MNVPAQAANLIEGLVIAEGLGWVEVATDGVDAASDILVTNASDGVGAYTFRLTDGGAEKVRSVGIDPLQEAAGCGLVVFCSRVAASHLAGVPVGEAASVSLRAAIAAAAVAMREGGSAAAGIISALEAVGL